MAPHAVERRQGRKRPSVSPSRGVEAGADRSMSGSKTEITLLIDRWSEGDGDAFDRLVDLVYDDLRRLARHHLRRSHRYHTLDTTGLVHEAYLKLVGFQDSNTRNRAQFFAFFSRAMRRILIDYARARNAEKRGGTRIRVPLSEDSATVKAQAVELLAVDEALTFLGERDPRLTRVVECRFFGGLTVPETAAALGTSTRTVERDWARARAFLYRALVPRDETARREGAAGESGEGEG